MENKKVKIYQMSEGDFVAGYDADSCIDCYCRNCLIDEADYRADAKANGFPVALTDGEIDENKFTNVDDPHEKELTFREALDAMIRNGNKFPELFITTEY